MAAGLVSQSAGLQKSLAARLAAVFGPILRLSRPLDVRRRSAHCSARLSSSVYRCSHLLVRRVRRLYVWDCVRALCVSLGFGSDVFISPNILFGIRECIFFSLFASLVRLFAFGSSFHFIFFCFPFLPLFIISLSSGIKSKIIYNLTANRFGANRAKRTR